MFPSAKKRKGSPKARLPAKKKSPGKSVIKGRDAKSPKRGSPGGQHRDKPGWRGSRDGEKQFGKKMKPGGTAFRSKKSADTEHTFSGKKKGGNKQFGNKNKDKRLNSKGQRGKSGFIRKGASAKQGFKQRKGKG